MTKWDVLIIGSGISSLTAGILLARSGKSVCILEQQNKPGGYMHCFNRFGHKFDTGAHYVGAIDKGQPFYTILRNLNVYDADIFTPLDQDGFDLFSFPSFEVRFARGYPATIDNIVKVFPNEEKAIVTFFEMIKTAARSFPTYEFNDEYDSTLVRDVLSESLECVVSKLTNNDRLKCVFYAYSSLHGVRADDVSFGLHALVTDSLIRSASTFKDGGDKLASNFVNELERLGGVLKLGYKVEKLVVRGKCISEVVCQNGEHFTADIIISGIHPKNTFDLIDGEHIRPAFASRLRNIEESGGVFGIYGELSDSSAFEPSKNYYYFSSDRSDDLLNEYKDGEEPSIVFLNCPNRSEIACTKTFAFTAYVPLSTSFFAKWSQEENRHKCAEYVSEKKRIAESVFRFLEKKNPAFRNVVIRYECSTPLTNITYNGSKEGAPFGIYHSIKNTGIRSLGPYTHFSNLLLTGQNTLFPGLLGSTISGIRTVGHIIGIKPLLRELREQQLGAK